MAGVAVQRSGGLVHDQNVGLAGDGAGDGDALLFAAAELDRRQIRAVFQSDNLQILVGLDDRFTPVFSPQNQRNRNVFGRGQAGEQMIVLKNEADLVQPKIGQLVVPRSQISAPSTETLPDPA